MTGKFITLEGIDGAGKSTHLPLVAQLVRDFLKLRQHRVVVTREPGGTWLGEQVRGLVLEHPMQIETEALLMFAARNEHLAQVIEPALLLGDWVVSDRFTDASFAYQGGGRGLAIAQLEALERWVHPQRQPDLTLLFDIDPEVAQQRLATRALDRFEQESVGFFNVARAEYQRRAQQFPKRFRIIDANLPLEQVQQQVRNVIQDFINP